MTIRPLRELTRHKTRIDLSGPEGNAFFLMSLGSRIARGLRIDFAPIQKEMMNGDYDHLVEVFEDHFGDHVDIYR